MLKVFEVNKKSSTCIVLGFCLLFFTRENPPAFAEQTARTTSNSSPKVPQKISKEAIDWQARLKSCLMQFLQEDAEGALAGLSKLRQELESKNAIKGVISCLLAEAEINESSGQLNQAEALMKQAMEKSLPLGNQSAEHAEVLAAMASYHALKGDLSAARAEQEQSMAILKDKNADLEKSRAYLALARRQKAEGTFGLADDSYKAALQLRDTHLKENDADSLIICREYADLLLKLERKDEAGKLKDRLNVAKSTATNGTTAQNPASSIFSSGGQSAFSKSVAEARSREKSGDSKEAINSWKLVLEKVEGQKGMEEQTSFALLHLADSYAAAQDFEQALSLYKKALSIHESDGTEKSLAAARVLTRIAHRYSMEKRYSDSEALLKKALEIEESSAADPRMQAETLQALLSSAMVNKDNSTVETSAKKLLAVSERINTENALNYRRTAIASLGSIYMQSGKIQEGMNLMKELSSPGFKNTKSGAELARLYTEEYKEVDKIVDEKQMQF